MSELIAKRLESRISEVINTMIVSEIIKNPKLSRFCSVTRIDLAVDNSAATVYVSALNEAQTKKSAEALNSASGFIQARLSKVVSTKNTPKLKFIPDNSYIEGERINKLIEDAIKNDEK